MRTERDAAPSLHARAAEALELAKCAQFQAQEAVHEARVQAIRSPEGGYPRAALAPINGQWKTWIERHCNRNPVESVQPHVRYWGDTL